MTKEDLLKAINDGARVDELIRGKSYIIQVEVGDMPKEAVHQYLTNMKEGFSRIGLTDCLFAAKSGSLGELTFYKINDRSVFEEIK